MQLCACRGEADIPYQGRLWHWLKHYCTEVWVHQRQPHLRGLSVARVVQPRESTGTKHKWLSKVPKKSRSTYEDSSKCYSPNPFVFDSGVWHRKADIFLEKFTGKCATRWLCSITMWGPTQTRGALSMPFCEVAGNELDTRESLAFENFLNLPSSKEISFSNSFLGTLGDNRPPRWVVGHSKLYQKN